jgi:hypothetical protein
VSGSDPASLLAGALRADAAADDWRAKVRADVDQLVHDIDAEAFDRMHARSAGPPAGSIAVPVCTCPDAHGYCRDDCGYCTALSDDMPCPADVVADAGDDAASWSPGPVEVPGPLEPGPVEVPGPLEEVAPVGPDPRGVLAHPGWRSRHDPASRGFAVVDRLAGKAPLRDVHLPWTPVLDQGKEGACVGFGVADAVNVLRVLSGGPGVTFLDNAAALDLYHQAQRVDDVPGEAYTGTSVLAGMKAGRADGYFGGYLWDFGTSAIAQTLLQLHTPVVVGVPWSEAMYETGPGGLVRLGGKVVGGHCLCIVGLVLKGPQDQPGPYFIWRNSWGTGYGEGGDGYVHHRDLAALLARQGEAAVPVVGVQTASVPLP